MGGKSEITLLVEGAIREIRGSKFKLIQEEEDDIVDAEFESDKELSISSTRILNKYLKYVL